MIVILLEEQIAFHCGPALAGIKPSNLVSCCNEKNPNIKKYISYLNNHLNKNDIYFETMCNCPKRTLVFVYRKKHLCEYIDQEDNKAFLKSFGYPMENDLQDIIEFMKKRIQINQNFPHEIGIFLGYPLSDIEKFIQNKGDNYKVNGYWKVYDNQEQIVKLFESYTRCRKTLLKHINSGASIVKLFGKTKKAS